MDTILEAEVEGKVVGEPVVAGMEEIEEDATGILVVEVKGAVVLD